MLGWLKKYFFRKEKIVCDPAFNVDEAIKVLSQDNKTKNFSGRDLSNIIRAVKSEIYASENMSLNSRNWRCSTEQICRSIQQKRDQFKH